MIRFFNTLTNQLEEFKPINEGVVGMYNCGPTVYYFAHIGNMRAYIFADLLRRFLEHENFKVTQVINITDVGHLQSDADEGEDKMEVGAKRENKSAKDIASFYTKAFLDDLKTLNINTAGTIFPKATEHISEQIDLIKILEEKGFTYKTSDGVYFDTSKFPEYGKLGQINLSGMEEGARVNVNEEKKNFTDFALWKFSPKDGGKREQEWESPWGVGFPGWHLECSAMSMKYLGETFDLHTGGIDHIPTHHQNEIAQSEAATGKKFVNYWMHSEHIRINNERIAKSLGNTILLKDLVEKGYTPLSYRYFLLLSHYKTPTNFTWEGLDAAETAYRRLKQGFSLLPQNGVINEKYQKEFLKALDEDLNTSEALGVLWNMMKDDAVKPEDKRATLLDFDKILALDLLHNEFEIKEVPQELKALLAERAVAREKEDYKKADEIRDKIASLGFEVRDTEEGQKLTKI